MTDAPVSTRVPDPPLEPEAHARAILNILEDFGAEKELLGDTQRAILNILDDASQETTRLADTQKAILNILDDAGDERVLLEQTQKAMLNILHDFDDEKLKVEQVNAELRGENRERRLTALALTERSIDLARSNADLEQFAYVASHDLQEPLRMVSSYVTLLERQYKGKLDAKADKYIMYAVEGASRMQALIGGLLEYSRVGLDESARRDQPLDGAVDLAVANLRTALDESQALVERGPLPRVHVDQGQIAQVLQNLISNGLKFRKPDVPATIRITSELRENAHHIAVADNGIGIEDQYFDRIFMIFQRLHTRADYPGTGIGLSICKKVVERHGGRIWVTSQRGAGTTFHFTLPVASGAT